MHRRRRLRRYNPAVTRSRTHKPPARPRHAWLYALRDGCLPASVTCNGQRFRLVETFKHDFFAATGLYEGPDGLAVLKMGRTNDILSVPAAWIGSFLTGREVHMYEQVQDLAGVPRLIGRVGQTGFLHAYVPGRPLGREDEVSDTFFDELQQMLATIHGRDMAYVDLNKRQNVLLGEDGKPYLIDFQISLHLPQRGWTGLAPLRWLLRRFQAADNYHVLKHKRRLRRDLLSETEAASVERLSIWIRLHRLIARPLTNLRRRVLRRMARSETTDVAGSAAK